MFTNIETIGMIVSLTLMVATSFPMIWTWVKGDISAANTIDTEDDSWGTTRHCRSCKCTAKSLSRGR